MGGANGVHVWGLARWEQTRRATDGNVAEMYGSAAVNHTRVEFGDCYHGVMIVVNPKTTTGTVNVFAGKQTEKSVLNGSCVAFVLTHARTMFHKKV